MSKPKGYQSFRLGAERKPRPGRYDTEAQFYSFDIAHKLRGASFLDLGCNIGGLPFLAEAAGASPCLGVEKDPEFYQQALALKAEHGMASEFVNADVATFEAPHQFDYVTCMAVFRHIFAQIVRKYDPSFKRPSKFGSNNPIDVLIRGVADYPRAAYDDYHAVIRRLVGFARKQFIASYHDESGVIARRQEEVERYFHGLDSRVAGSEVYYSWTERPYVTVALTLR